jgi:1-deoxy-D-xylulose-5-phosphate synthase
MHFPDRFIDHDKPVQQFEAAGLNARHMVAKALDALGIVGDAATADVTRTAARGFRAI